MPEWNQINRSGPLPALDHPPFTITAPPNTDVWRPDPTHDTFTAPFLYQRLATPAFHRIRVTISAPWKTQYDQGGLMLVFRRPAASTPRDEPAQKWLKAGVEFFDGRPHLAVVGCDRFADWSLAPVPPADAAVPLTFEAERDGQTLWVRLVRPGAAGGGGGGPQVLREVKWAFWDAVADADAGAGAGEIWVGAYAAKPTPEPGDAAAAGIEVTFSELVVETAA